MLKKSLSYFAYVYAFQAEKTQWNKKFNCYLRDIFTLFFSAGIYLFIQRPRWRQLLHSGDLIIKFTDISHIVDSEKVNAGLVISSFSFSKTEKPELNLLDLD